MNNEILDLQRAILAGDDIGALTLLRAEFRKRLPNRHQDPVNREAPTQSPSSAPRVADEPEHLQLQRAKVTSIITRSRAATLHYLEQRLADAIQATENYFRDGYKLRSYALSFGDAAYFGDGGATKTLNIHLY